MKKAPGLPVTIEWCDGVSDSMREALEPYITEWSWVVPTWCHTLYVDTAGMDVGTLGLCIAEPEYRRATVKFGHAWFRSSEPMRHGVILHELLHISNNPLGDAAEHLIETYVPEPARVLAKETIRLRIEELTADMENAVLRRVRPDLAPVPLTPKRRRRRRVSPAK